MSSLRTHTPVSSQPPHAWQGLKSKSFKIILSVPAPPALAPSRASFNKRLVNPSFLGLPFIPRIFTQHLLHPSRAFKKVRGSPYSSLFFPILNPTFLAMSQNSFSLKLSRLFRRLSNCSLNFTAFSCIISCVSSEPPKRAKFFPLVTLTWPSLQSNPKPNNNFLFTLFIPLILLLVTLPLIETCPLGT